MSDSILQPQLQRALKLVSIIAPAYNEEANLPLLYKRICAVMEKVNKNFEIIVIENGSADTSLDILKELHGKDGRLNFLSLTRNFGHQGALLAGLDHSKGDVVISMDADLQHPPELIPEMLERWKDGYDVVYTLRRQNKAQSFLRKAFGSFFYILMNKLSGIELHGQSDFRLMDRKAVDIICKLQERNKFLRGLNSWIGFRQIGLKYDLGLRKAGKSKFRFIHLVELAIDGVFSFSIIPLRIFTLCGLAISFVSFIYGIYLSVLKIYMCIGGYYNNWSPPGWVTLVFVMLFFGGIQLLGIGLLGEYIGRVYDEVKRRPSYIIREDSFAKD